jgi:integrase
MALTDAKLRALKRKADPYKVSDSEGLHILVSSGGSKLWRLAYRYTGKQKTLALGKYPTVSLFEARRAREAAKRLLQLGIDPSADRKAQRRQIRAAGSNTFEIVANEWFEQKRNRWVKSYSDRLKSRMDGDLVSDLGERPVAEIEPQEVLKVIRRVEERGAVEMARRVMQMASAIFRYGVATARCSRDPTTDLKGALRPAGAAKHRTALPVAELPAFLRNVTVYDGAQTTRLAVSLVMLTFVRTSELRFARWPEIEDLHGNNPLWRIPPDRMKMRRGHLVPLAPQAVRILRDLHKLTGKSPYLFPSNTKTGVISENTLIFALYRMGYHGRATVHGFRSTASTILNENDFNRDWIEMQLAHFDGSVRGVYNAAEWLEGRRKMMCWWADYLDKLRTVGTVIQLDKKSA